MTRKDGQNCRVKPGIQYAAFSGRRRIEPSCRSKRHRRKVSSIWATTRSPGWGVSAIDDHQIIGKQLRPVHAVPRHLHDIGGRWVAVDEPVEINADFFIVGSGLGESGGAWGSDEGQLKGGRIQRHRNGTTRTHTSLSNHRALTARDNRPRSLQWCGWKARGEMRLYLADWVAISMPNTEL